MTGQTQTHSHIQPNSHYCFVCGLQNPAGLKVRFKDNGVDEVRTTYVIGDQHQGYPGIAHGGILASILDETGGRVVMAGDHTRFFMTARLNIQYRKPVPTNKELTLVGTLVNDRGRVVKAHAAIYLPNGEIGTEADLTLVEMPAEHDEVALNELGWRVYTDEEYANATKD